jgi:hypothetical protein
MRVDPRDVWRQLCAAQRRAIADDLARALGV